MVLGVLFGNKSYPMAKYLFILTVVLGVAMFMYKDKPVTAKQEIDTGMGIGEILLVRPGSKHIFVLHYHSLVFADFVSYNGRTYRCHSRTDENRISV